MLKLQKTLSQKLNFSAKQQQSVRLLQYSTFELNQEILKVLEQNPFIELEHYNTEQQKANVDLADDIEYDHWNQAVSQSTTDFIEETYSTRETLHEHLKWQLDTRHFEGREHIIAQYILDAIDNKGYFKQDINELTRLINISPKPNATEALKVLKKIQSFDPIGIAARNLQECLLLQLKNYRDYNPDKKLALNILQNEFKAFCTKEFELIKTNLKISETELKLALQTIKSLNPNPGVKYDSSSPVYIVPDLTIRKVSGNWQVSLYDDLSQKIKVKQNKNELLSRVTNVLEKEFINTYYNEAKWLKKCVDSRNSTLLKVGKAIIERQIEFIEKGEAFMRELKLEQIAETTKLHISTVSRAVSQKYIQTPHGTLELKYFFRKNLIKNKETSVSSYDIKQLIKDIIKKESLTHPLSDEKITQKLKNKGINISRRTVTKYRKAMDISSSAKRKIRP